jgi:hypothetical protein
MPEFLRSSFFPNDERGLVLAEATLDWVDHGTSEPAPFRGMRFGRGVF